MIALYAVVLTALASATPTPSVPRVDKHTDVGPFTFTSTYSVIARPNEVVNSSNQYTGGLEGTAGIFKYGINSNENIICFNITLDGFRGEYESPAKTATHIHEGPVGKAGPPRIVFPNPESIEGRRRNSVGCLRGPFVTGVVVNGKDTGVGFHVRQIEQNMSAFFTDVHSSLALPGAARGQLSGKKC